MPLGFVGFPRIRSLAFLVVRQPRIASKIFSWMAEASSAMMRMFGEWPLTLAPSVSPP